MEPAAVELLAEALASGRRTGAVRTSRRGWDKGVSDHRRDAESLLAASPRLHAALSPRVVKDHRPKLQLPEAEPDAVEPTSRLLAEALYKTYGKFLPGAVRTADWEEDAARILAFLDLHRAALSRPAEPPPCRHPRSRWVRLSDSVVLCGRCQTEFTHELKSARPAEPPSDAVDALIQYHRAAPFHLWGADAAADEARAREELAAARPAEGALDAAWKEAEEALPEGGRITLIIEAWAADSRRLAHAGMHRTPMAAAAALQALAKALREGAM